MICVLPHINCPELYIESHPYGGLFYFGGGYGGYGGDVWAFSALRMPFLPKRDKMTTMNCDMTGRVTK